MRVLSVCLVATFLGCTAASRASTSAASAAVAAAPARQEAPSDLEERFLSPAELLKRMEASKVKYRLGETVSGLPGLEQSAQRAWPLEDPLPWPVRVETEGGVAVRPLEWSAALHDAMMDAERDYRAQRFEAAERGYARILSREPSFLPALLGHGDAAYFAGRAQDALVRYDRAVEVAPHDHRVHFFRGNALLRLGRAAEARAAFARALALRPRGETLILALENGRAGPLGVEVRRPFLHPRGMWRTNDDGSVDVKLEPGRPHWFAWALCKAYWSAEPAHRKLRTGNETHTFSIIEELECLAVMAAAYDSREERAPDPDIEQISRILLDRFGTELVVYEIAARMDPHVALRQSPAALEKLVEYVNRYVIPPAR